MTKKIILYGLGNYGKHNFYIFDKKQEVANSLSKMFRKIFGLYWDFYEEDYKTREGKELNVEKFKDKHESLRNTKSQSKVDIFYGDKKMFITINCSQKLRLRFNEELDNISKMLEKNKK